MSGSHKSRVRGDTSGTGFGTILLGGAGAWTMHLLLAYAISEFGCLAGLGDHLLGGITLVAWLLLGLSIVAFVLAAAATAASVRLRRAGRRFGPETETFRSLDFGWRLALVTNGTFTIVIAVQSVPILFFLGRC